MAVLYATGWEAGSNARYATNGAIFWAGMALDTTVAYQHRTAAGNGGTYCTSPGWGLRSSATIPTSARWFNFYAAPENATSHFWVIFALGLAAQITVRFDTTGAIIIYRGTTIVSTTYSAWNTQVGHWISINAVAQDAPNGVCDVYVDEVLVASVPAGSDMQQQASPDWSLVAFGNFFGPITDTIANFCAIRIDEVIITDDTTGRVGPQWITAVVPTSDSAPLTLTPSTGVVHYVLVDEIPDNTADYNAATAAGQEDFYGLGNLTFGVDVLCVSVLANAYADGTITMGEAAITSGATTVYQTPVVLPVATYYNDVYLLDTDPDTGIAWTVAGVNAAFAGYRFT